MSVDFAPLVQGAGSIRSFLKGNKMKKQIALRLRQIYVGAALAGVAGVSMAAAPLTAADLATGISWADATTATLIGSAAIIGYKVLKQAATIVMGLIHRAN